MGKFIITEEEKNRIRGLYEQSSNNGQKAIDTIKAAMTGPGTSEQNVIKGALMIKTDEDYKTALSIANKEGYKTIMHMISTDMSSTPKGITGVAKAVVGADDDRSLTQISNHLKKFNPQEVIYDKK